LDFKGLGIGKVQSDTSNRAFETGIRQALKGPSNLYNVFV